MPVRSSSGRVFRVTVRVSLLLALELPLGVVCRCQRVSESEFNTRERLSECRRVGKSDFYSPIRCVYVCMYV